MVDPRLRSIPFLAHLDDGDLRRIEASTTERRIPAGETLFSEGDQGHQAYVIVEGEIEITKRSPNRDILLAVRGPGEVIGEMSLLEEAPRMAGAKTRTDSVVLEVPKSVFDDLLDTSPAAARSLFGVLLARWRETEARLRQREQLAQLGTLSAGLAHELNNPAAAVNRAVAGFGVAADRLAAASGVLRTADPDGALTNIIDRIASADPQRLGSIARGDRQNALSTRLGELGIEHAATFAPVLADIDGESVDSALDDLAENPDRPQVAAAMAVAVARREVSELAGVALEGATRISDIVRAVKSYAFTGQAPIQEVDLARMLDDTLVLLGHKLGDIEVIKEYGGLPSIEAYGSELNQVWTNLLDNAADAIRDAGRTPGRIVLRTRLEDNEAVVEIEDDGTGIPEEVLPRVFDSFFTTKPPGSGTGLGLDISYGIVTTRHGGAVDIDSEPGRTTVRVRLPIAAS